MSEESRPDMAPEDEVPTDAPSSGEDVCPECHGTGERDGATCPGCEGTGRIVEAIGGG
jgi:DnaJ-class molecular chaperone